MTGVLAGDQRLTGTFLKGRIFNLFKINQI